MRKIDGLSTIVILSLIALSLFVWGEILLKKPIFAPKIYFLDVGQGDSELLVLPGNVKILADAGPNQKILESIGKVLGRSDNYIDIGIISHPQLDHFNGFNYLLNNYKFGAFISNGRTDSPGVEEWQTLTNKIKSQKIPLITLAAHDRIRIGTDQIDFLSPGPEHIQSAELNDTGLVELIKTASFRALLTADTGFNIEDYLLDAGVDIKADILKIAHHGSKYSSSESFLRMVNPRVTIAEVGARNKYGHPTPEIISRLASIKSKIFRTDQNGTVEIVSDGQKLKVFTER